jgi:hypothetical protein
MARRGKGAPLRTPWRTGRELLERLQAEHPGPVPAGLCAPWEGRLKIGRRDIAPHHGVRCDPLTPTGRKRRRDHDGRIYPDRPVQAKAPGVESGARRAHGRSERRARGRRSLQWGLGKRMIAEHLKEAASGSIPE